MTPLALVTGTAGVLLLLAVAGPLLVRRAAPALIRSPRLGVGLLVGGVVAWTTALLALGPLLAWSTSAPTVLRGAPAEVCRQCLAASNPFTGTALDSSVPAVLLLAVPAALALTLLAGTALTLVRHRATGRRDAAALGLDGVPDTVLGHRVTVLEHPVPTAFAMPPGAGGIAVSTGALAVLDEAELRAVLAHEQAHLDQRHHLVTALLAAASAMLGWIPLVSAVAAAVPHYLEVAADDQARRRAGTTALVGALVKLSQPTAPAAGTALRMAGPGRIHHLVAPVHGAAGTFWVSVIAALVLVLTAASAAVHLPYTVAALTGCTV